jgi:hypothetical protein
MIFTYRFCSPTIDREQQLRLTSSIAIIERRPILGQSFPMLKKWLNNYVKSGALGSICMLFNIYLHCLCEALFGDGAVVSFGPDLSGSGVELHDLGHRFLVGVAR